MVFFLPLLEIFTMVLALEEFFLALLSFLVRHNQIKSESLGRKCLTQRNTYATLKNIFTKTIFTILHNHFLQKLWAIS